MQFCTVLLDADLRSPCLLVSMYLNFRPLVKWVVVGPTTPQPACLRLSMRTALLGFTFMNS